MNSWSLLAAGLKHGNRPGDVESEKSKDGLCHLLARNGPGYFFNGDEKYEPMVHSEIVLTGTMRYKKRDELLRRMPSADSSMEVSRYEV